MLPIPDVQTLHRGLLVIVARAPVGVVLRLVLVVEAEPGVVLEARWEDVVGVAEEEEEEDVGVVEGEVVAAVAAVVVDWFMANG